MKEYNEYYEKLSKEQKRVCDGLRNAQQTSMTGGYKKTFEGYTVVRTYGGTGWSGWYWPGDIPLGMSLYVAWALD